MPASRPERHLPGPGLTPPVKASRGPLFLIGGLIFVFLLGVFWAFLGLLPDPLATAKWPFSTRVTDRNATTLTTFPSPLGYQENRRLADFSPYLVASVLAAEDHRFYYHLGLDPLAVARALGQNLKARSLVSGGSTITAQLARLSLGLYPGPRTFSRKLKELWVALLIERHHSKDEILASYLNSVPTGPLSWGLATASWEYLGKDVQYLSPAEAAFLAALPKTPHLNDFPRLNQRRAWILGRLKAKGLLDEPSYVRAIKEPLSLKAPRRPFLAPHFLTRLKGRDLIPALAAPASLAPASLGPGALKAPPTSPLKTTLDLTIQKDLEKMVADTASDLAALGLTQAAVVVLSLPKREVLAWVGSTDFFDPQEGQNDGVLALRQPGSALKPFIYQLALEEGLITAGTILEDGPIDFSSSQGSFTPRNYGETYHGPVPARVALASSLNIPAIKLIKALGPKKVLKRLNALGLNFKDDSDFYGLGLALGNGEVSLLALTNAYASMALNGASGEPQTLAADPKPAGDRPKTLSLMDPGAAFIVSHILADDGARALGFGRGGVLATPYPAAVKTGTSQNFRDNWCVGYTERFVIGVWAGNFQGQPMGKVSGVTGAGQLWRKIADYLVTRYPPGPLKPIAGVVANEICPISGLLKGPKCPNGVREYFLSKLPFPKVCDHDLMGQNLAPELSLTLISPKSQETYAVDPSLAPDYQLLATKVVVGPAINEVRWLINGSLIARKTPQNGRAQAFLPLERGYIKLTVLGLKNQDIVAETSANYLVK